MELEGSYIISLEHLHKLVNAFTDIEIPIEAVEEEVEYLSSL